jgi:hypothetical protein
MRGDSCGICIVGIIDEAKVGRKRQAPGDGMRMIWAGFSGWARMRDTKNESLKVVDTAITVVATLLVAVTWTVLHR